MDCRWEALSTFGTAVCLPSLPISQPGATVSKAQRSRVIADASNWRGQRCADTVAGRPCGVAFAHQACSYAAPYWVSMWGLFVHHTKRQQARSSAAGQAASNAGTSGVGGGRTRTNINDQT